LGSVVVVVVVEEEEVAAAATAPRSALDRCAKLLKAVETVSQIFMS
jgi:hypothetical protein